MSRLRASKPARGSAGWPAFLLAFGASLCLAAAVRAQRSSPTFLLPPERPAASPAEESGGAFQAISVQVDQVFAKCKGAVVRIEATDRYGPHAGTGFFIDPSGTVYTHDSVAGHSWNLLVQFAGKKYPATCLVADARSGVALLSIQAGQTPFLPIGKSEDLKVAAPLIAIGYPMDLPVSPTLGLVAGFDQKFVDRPLAMTHIRANVPVQSGEQGAPLLNLKGEVVGIISCQFDYGAVCLSLPIQAAEKVRADYLRFGAVRPGWLGITAKPVSADDEEAGGVRVDELAESSPAARCGLQEGDLIRTVGRTPIRRFGDLRDASFYLTANEVVPITVQRDGKDLTVAARAADLPGTTLTSPPVLTEMGGGGPRLELPTH